MSAIFADASLLAAVERYDPSAEALLLHSSPRLQAKGQAWAAHVSLTKSDVNVQYPFQVIGTHQNLGGRSGCGSFDYWTVGFSNLRDAARAYCDVYNMQTPHLEEVRFDADALTFVHKPNPGRLEFERDAAEVKEILQRTRARELEFEPG